MSKTKKFNIVVNNYTTDEQFTGEYEHLTAQQAALTFIYIEPTLVSDEVANEMDKLALDNRDYTMDDLRKLLNWLEIEATEIK